MNELMLAATQVLHDQGGRMTAQRRAILETLEAMGGHPTAEEVYQAARQSDRAINPSTVYRTLHWLADAGLVAATWLGPERCRRQEPLGRAVPVEHHHFVCTSCGQVIEFTAPQVAALRADFCAAHGASVERAAVTLYGVCASCQDSE